MIWFTESLVVPHRNCAGLGVTSLRRSALLPYPAGRVYEVVSDIDRYCEFLPWCTDSKIVAREGRIVTATLEFGAIGLKERVTTRNTLAPQESIELELVSGPFSRFMGVWSFTQVGDADGCKVTFDLDYQLAKRHVLLGPAFVNRATDKLVDAFVERCVALLG
jgi:ribosome-associated toxin RatA of RatAB toxin-antitoxin module